MQVSLRFPLAQQWARSLVGGKADDAPRKATLRALSLALAAVGLLLVGQGSYIHAKALLAQVLLKRAFAATLADRQPHKPWPWADMVPVARLEVPRLNESAIVLGGASGQALAFGPAEVAGAPVIAGHRDTHFDFLGELRPGDEIRLTRADGRTSAYRIVRTEVADIRKGSLPVPDAAHGLVLVTCYPLEARLSGPLRYLVHAEAVR